MIKTIAGVRVDRRRVIGLIVAAVGGIALALLYQRIDVRAAHEKAAHLNGILLFALMVVLPLVGFPVTVTHAVAGMRFGLKFGLLLVAVSTILQMLASYGLVKLAPRMFARRLEGVRRRLPSGAHVPVTLFTMLVPGVPYFVKNYALPLVGVPLRTGLLWGAPIHIVRSVVALGLGRISDHPTPLRVAAFTAYYVVVTAGCVWAFRRARAQVKDRPPAADGRT